MNELKSYGFIEPDIADVEKSVKKGFVLGARGGMGVETPIINLGGDWGQFLPIVEAQSERFERYSCTIINTLHSLAALFHFKNGQKKNWSERWNYIKAKIMPPGADPHRSCDSIKDFGVIDEELLPDGGNSLEEYRDEKVLTQEMIEASLKLWNKNESKSRYLFGHEWVYTGELPIAEKHRLIREALKRGTVCVSVAAWFLGNDGLYYSPPNTPPNHWTFCYGYKDGKYPQIFDSYDSFTKTLREDFDFKWAKVFYIIDKKEIAEQLNIIQKLILIISETIRKMFVEKKMIDETEISNPISDPLPPEAPPVVSVPRNKIVEWAKAIATYENAPKSWCNPGAIRSKKGNFLQFKTYDEGFAYLCDYLKRAATGEHKAYKPDFTLLRFFETYAPAQDKNNPRLYANFVSSKIGETINTKIKDLV